MKRTIFLATIIALAVLGAASGAKAQVTIGANTAPRVTLDIQGKASTASTADGLIIPSMTGDQLAAKMAANAYNGITMRGTLVFITTPPTGTAPAELAKVTEAGFYYLNGSVWFPLLTGDEGTHEAANPADSTTASNGLTEVGNDIQLGGALTKKTTISGTDTLVIGTPLKITSGSPGDGYVLVSNASGYATWQPPITSTTFRGVLKKNQEITIKPAITTANNVANCYIDSTSYIDLPKGLWHVFMSVPYRMADAQTTPVAVEVAIGLVHPSPLVFGMINWYSITQNFGSEGTGGTYAAGYMRRGVVNFFLNNENSGITRYYVSIGRLARRAETNEIPNGIIYMPEAAEGTIYATSTQFVN
jgi:hypothetical protein